MPEKNTIAYILCLLKCKHAVFRAIDVLRFLQTIQLPQSYRWIRLSPCSIRVNAGRSQVQISADLTCLYL